MLRFLLMACVSAGLAAGVLLLRRDEPGGFGWLWTAVAGPADQGPADFARLARRPTPNDALACGPGVCAARPDIQTPRYGASADSVRTIVRQVILSDPDAMQVAASPAPPQDRYVVRTRLLRFPDTVDVLVSPAGDGEATLAIYSRSLVGGSDFGANLRRIRAWLADPRLASLERR